MKYVVSYNHHHQHFIEMSLFIPVNGDKTTVQSAAWRPGRYELGNFTKNVRGWAAFDESGKALSFRKINKDKWEVDTKGVRDLHVKYSFYAADLNAGSTYLDDRQLYMNPVNCCMYVPERMNEPLQMELLLPEGYRIATALKKGKEKQEDRHFRHVLYADNFEQLADSPLIASPLLKHNAFVMDGIEFNIWLQGECKPDWAKIINDFFIFINEMVLMMKGSPVKEYHFLFHIVPYKFHHGVEHLASTVIVMGPSYNIMRDELYNDFLGISCHELFHSWNIKTIRPVEMYPYDYTKENYSRLGYVYEGITTYYGDYLLLRSGVFSEFEYLKAIQREFQKHFDNYGRYNLSVADSSFDTWLDGYVSGIPFRKVSIYTEGSILAFITDMFIRSHTENKKTLDDVMRALYENAKLGKPYSEADFKKIVEEVAGTSYDDIFNNYINKAADLGKPFREALAHIGMALHTSPAKKFCERYWGLKLTEEAARFKVTSIAPESPAENSGICVGDEIVTINGHILKNNFHDWCSYYENDQVSLVVLSEQIRREVSISPMPGKEFFPLYHVTKIPHANLEQQAAYRIWCNREF
ncbi:MAG: M61 family metallopeptidase [Bacteroidia bacterium]